MPNYEIGEYDSGPSSVIGCYSGPNGGLTTVRRTEKHLSILDHDIDFIDTYEEDTSKHLHISFFKSLWHFVCSHNVVHQILIIPAVLN